MGVDGAKPFAPVPNSSRESQSPTTPPFGWTHSRAFEKSPPRPRGPGRRERRCSAADCIPETSAIDPDRLQHRLPERAERIAFGYALGVNLQQMIAELDQEIARLEQARKLLASREESAVPRRGRPARKSAAGAKPKRRLSAEGLARIREAQKRRWAAQKKAAKKKAPASANTAE
jgi:hypothetical protein